MLAGILPAMSQRVSVKASLDSVYLLMGQITELKIEVDQPKGFKGHFPLLSQVAESGVIPVCNDSIELRSPSKIDTVETGNSLKITYRVPLQGFDSGYYRLPEFVFVSGVDSVKSNVLFLKVVPVKAEADTPINDFAGVADPENPSIFDYVPDWVIDYWWILIIVILAIGLFLWGMRRYKKQGSFLPQKPQPTPYEIAISALRSLKEKKLWEQGMEKEYFTELTDILREYLYGRFGINAMEMTSRQIMASLGKNEDTKEKRAYFRKILDMADFVKFAKVRPLPADNIESYDNALKFVEETKPVPVEPDAASEDGQNGENPDSEGKDNKKVKKSGKEVKDNV